VHWDAAITHAEEMQFASALGPLLLPQYVVCRAGQNIPASSHYTDIDSVGPNRGPPLKIQNYTWDIAVLRHISPASCVCVLGTLGNLPGGIYTQVNTDSHSVESSTRTVGVQPAAVSELRLNPGKVVVQPRATGGLRNSTEVAAFAASRSDSAAGHPGIQLSRTRQRCREAALTFIPSDKHDGRPHSPRSS
jgi:hypothetical protein